MKNRTLLTVLLTSAVVTFTFGQATPASPIPPSRHAGTQKPRGPGSHGDPQVKHDEDIRTILRMTSTCALP
ncbi:MAG: hypothetical protein IPP33_11900 [Flavobacteriales bacterium]|nr:hypothetical protein [Flavobacteriales bacterium]